MKATLLDLPASAAASRAFGDSLRRHRKERHFYSQLSAIDPATGRELVCARWYSAPRSNTAHCCVWVHPSKGDDYRTGGGSTGGGGYHRESEALANALKSAGIALSEDIAGRGDAAMRDAIEAVAKAVSVRRKVYIVEANA